MLKTFILASVFSLTIFSSVPLALADDCLGVSIGAGCLGLQGQRDRVYRRVEQRPANPRVYVGPNGGRYYYDDNTYYYEEEHVR